MIAPVSFPLTGLNFEGQDQKIHDSPFSNLKDLDALAVVLTSDDCSLDQWEEWNAHIGKFVNDNSQNLLQLDQFFKTITKWGIARDIQKTMEFFTGIASVDLLEDIARLKMQTPGISFKNAFEWAAINAPLCQEPVDNTMKAGFKREWRKYRRNVLYFIPNLINIFLSAFNFLNANRRFTTLWEKHLILEIIYKFFIIPLALVALLRPFFAAAAKVYLIAALIIVTTGILLASYQKWLRPLPDEIVNCTNLDIKMEKGLIDPKVGQADAMQELIAALEVDSNVLLIGNSGDGKTALMHQLIQLKSGGGQLPDRLQQLTAYEVDCGVMISSISIGHSELINQIKDQVEGYESQILLFFDEFYQIASNGSAFQAFKKRFLEDKPHAKFVAAVTYKEFQELKKHDIDGSFMRRITPILIESSSDQQTQIVVQDLINRAASDIPIADDALDAILDVSEDIDYLPEIGRPAKAIKILMDAVGTCRASYNPHYVSLELSQLRQDLFDLKLQAQPLGNASLDMLKKKKQIEDSIDACEEVLKKDKACLKKIQRIVNERKTMTQEYFRLTHLLSKAHQTKPQGKTVQQSINQKDQVLYLWTYLFGLDSMKEILQETIQKVQTPLSVQVDGNLIMSQYEKAKNIDACLKGCGTIVNPVKEEDFDVFEESDLDCSELG